MSYNEFKRMVEAGMYINAAHDRLTAVDGVESVSDPRPVENGIEFTVRIKPMPLEDDGKGLVRPKKVSPDWQPPIGTAGGVVPTPDEQKVWNQWGPLGYNPTDINTVPPPSQVKLDVVRPVRPVKSGVQLDVKVHPKLAPLFRLTNTLSHGGAAFPYRADTASMEEAVWGVSGVHPNAQCKTALSAFNLTGTQRTADMEFASVFAYTPPDGPEVNNIGMAVVDVDFFPGLVGKLAVINDDLVRTEALCAPAETKRLMGLGFAVIDTDGDMTVADVSDNNEWRKAFLAALKPGVIIYGSVSVADCRQSTPFKGVQSVTLIAVVGEQNVAVGHQNFGVLRMGAAQAEQLYKFLRTKTG